MTFSLYSNDNQKNSLQFSHYYSANRLTGFYIMGTLVINVKKQNHEGQYLNWLHKTILRLSHLFQIS